MSTSTGWQNEILVRLRQRDAQDKAHAEIIENCQRLAGHAAVLKERNRNLLKAAASTRTVSGGSSNSKSNGAAADDNPVRQAYTASLETQVSALRDELSSLYKTQAQNAQRLVHMTEKLHANQDERAAEHNEVLQLRLDRKTHEREREEAAQIRKEKDNNIELLQDELGMIKLEYEMLEKRNEALKEDNASLLRRWLEKKAQEAAAMDKELEGAKK